jgi:hypothetical protein
MTATETGALTVAGQWRTFTAFPNILAIAVMSGAAARGSGSDGMETTSMTSTFITGPAGEVKERFRWKKKRRVEGSGQGFEMVTPG